MTLKVSSLLVLLSKVNKKLNEYNIHQQTSKSLDSSNLYCWLSFVYNIYYWEWWANFPRVRWMLWWSWGLSRCKSLRWTCLSMCICISTICRTSYNHTVYGFIISPLLYWGLNHLYLLLWWQIPPHQHFQNENKFCKNRTMSYKVSAVGFAHGRSHFGKVDCVICRIVVI